MIGQATYPEGAPARDLISYELDPLRILYRERKYVLY